MYSKDYADFLVKHPLLKWEASYDELDDGLHKKQENFIKKRESNYMGLNFLITYNQNYSNPLILISGSIHKFMNGGEHNYNDFTMKSVLKTVLHLCTIFQINCHDVVVQAPEVGLNIDLGYLPDRSLFKRIILLHGDGGSIEPTSIAPKKVKGYDMGLQFILSDDYHLKFYVKDNGRLRVEVHIDRTQKVKKCHQLRDVRLSSLYDYCLPQNIRKIYQVLVLTNFEKIFIDEDIQKDNSITDEDFNFYKDHLSFRKWLETSGNKKRAVKKRIERVLSKHKCLSIKEPIKSLLEEKMKKCLVMDEEDYAVLEKLNRMDYLRLKSQVKNNEITSDYHSIGCNLMLNHESMTFEFNPKQNYGKVKLNAIDEIVSPSFVNSSYCIEMNFKWYLSNLKRVLKCFDTSISTKIISNNPLNQIEAG